MTEVNAETAQYRLPPEVPSDPLALLDGLRAAVLAQDAGNAARLAAAEAELGETRAERDRWRDDCGLHQEAGRRLEASLAEAVSRNQTLREELLELYRDLRAEDLPTLILRVAMNLTGAESGMFTDASGELALASIGLDGLPAEVVGGVHQYAHKAINQDEPIVCNDAEELPDGAGLVNLAALPVAALGSLKGAIVVANKRSGPFDDEDTDLLLSIGRHAGIAMENNRLHCELAEAYVGTVAVLSDAIMAKDPYTRGHCEAVSSVAVRVAERLGLEKEALEQVRYAGLLHDIGKIGVPDGILLKPGRLLPEEYLVVQRHASIGSDLVSRVPALLLIAPIIRHHHERYDGSGYPEGLSGERISLASRIIAVVDALDAMTSPRPYRNEVSLSEALQELRAGAGGQFDPLVVEVVSEMLADESAWA